jgi:hypothetical protein
VRAVDLLYFASLHCSHDVPHRRFAQQPVLFPSHVEDRASNAAKAGELVHARRLSDPESDYVIGDGRECFAEGALQLRRRVLSHKHPGHRPLWPGKRNESHARARLPPNGSGVRANDTASTRPATRLGMLAASSIATGPENDSPSTTNRPEGQALANELHEICVSEALIGRISDDHRRPLFFQPAPQAFEKARRAIQTRQQNDGQPFPIFIPKK